MIRHVALLLLVEVARSSDSHHSCRQICHDECRDAELPPDASEFEIISRKQCRTICRLVCLRDDNFWASGSGIFELKSTEGVPREFINACNMERCFNYSRCSPHKFGIYIYPMSAEEQPFRMSDEYRKVLDAIRASPDHVTNPQEACVFVPGFDTLCLFNSCHQNSELASRISHSLRLLPYWDGGRNHIVFDYSDFLTRYDVGMAMLFKSSMSQRMYRHGYDVVVPLYARFVFDLETLPPKNRSHSSTDASSDQSNGAPDAQTLDANRIDSLSNDEGSNENVDGEQSPANATTKRQRVKLVYRSIITSDDARQHQQDAFYDLTRSEDIPGTQNAPPTWDRNYLLTFKGSRYSNFGQIRNRLYVLDNGRDVIIRAKCFLGISYDEQCDSDMKAYNDYDYADLLLRSKFGLVVPGVGEHSYRLLEVLQAGGIPVILNDDAVLPLEGLVQWDSFSIRIPEAQLDQVVPFLRGLSDNAVASLQRRAKQAHDTYFASTTTYIQRAIEILKSRIWFYRPF